jgi:molybdate transport system substrate-binding protein
MKRLALVCAAVALTGPAAALACNPVQPTVVAASSLTDVFPALAACEHYSFGGSDQLAFQIRQGAPADVFAAASPKYPQALYRERLVYKPVVFATNRLVVIVPRSNPARIRSVYDLRRRGIRLVIGAVGVPIGDYTRKVLTRLGLSGVLRNVVSDEPDVRGIVTKVALAEADAGFVYVTDLRTAAGKLRAVPIPARAQPTVRYEIAVVRSTKRLAAAREFVRLVLGPDGRRELRRYGFGLP